MSVSSVKPFANTQGGVDAEGTQTYTNVYHVYTNSKDDGADTARGPAAVTAGLPDYNDPWAWGNDSNAYALAKTRQAELAEVNDATPYYKKWRVTIGYTTAGQSRDSSGGGGSGSGSQEGVQDPVSEQWKISGSYTQTTESTSVDRNGLLIWNSSEEERIVDRPSGFDTIITSGNTSTISLPIRAAAVMKCNSTTMWGLAIRQVYLSQWSWDILYRGTTAYVAHRLEWWIADPSILWNTKFPDTGTRTMDVTKTGNARYKALTSSNDTNRTGLLDGAGGEYNYVTAPPVTIHDYEVIDQYDFLANLTFLTDPLPGPFV